MRDVPCSCLCDRCNTEMVERNCKITCPNGGSRFDCSDLTIYLDAPRQETEARRHDDH